MKYTRRTALKTGGGLLGAAIAMPFISRPSVAAGQTLRLAFGDVVTSPIRPALQKFADRVSSETNGEIQVQLFGLGELGSQVNTVTGLQTGIIDLSAQSSGFIQRVIPELAAVDLPYVFASNEAAEKVLDGEVGNRLLELMAPKGIEGLCWGHWGWRPVSAVQREMPNPADMAGLKIRVQPGAIFAETFRAVGAIPVVVDASEVYLALSQNTIEAIEQPLVTIVAQKLYEIVKVVNQTNFVYNAGVLMASKTKMEALSEAQRKIIVDAARDLSPDWRGAAAAASVEAIEALKKNNVKLIEVDTKAYAAATSSVYEQFRGTIGSDLMDLLLKQTGRA